MGLIRRAGIAYYRANVAAWVALKKLLPRDIDPWVLVSVAFLGATVTLVADGHSGAAMAVAAASLWVLVLQRAVDR
jgi:hypothetical protein